MAVSSAERPGGDLFCLRVQVTQKRARLLRVILAVVGVVVGGWYAYGVIWGLFTASDQDVHNPLMWIAVLCGPGSTLLAVLVGFVKPKIAGRWLIGGGVLSGAATMLTSDKPLEMLAAVVFLFTGPMVALGYGFVVLAGASETTASGAWGTWRETIRERPPE
jgi:hypothetical protein